MIWNNQLAWRVCIREFVRVTVDKCIAGGVLGSKHRVGLNEVMNTLDIDSFCLNARVLLDYELDASQAMSSSQCTNN